MSVHSLVRDIGDEGGKTVLFDRLAASHSFSDSFYSAVTTAAKCWHFSLLMQNCQAS